MNTLFDSVTDSSEFCSRGQVILIMDVKKVRVFFFVVCLLKHLLLLCLICNKLCCTGKPNGHFFWKHRVFRRRLSSM